MAVSMASANPGIKSKLNTIMAERIPQSFKYFLLSTRFNSPLGLKMLLIGSLSPGVITEPGKHSCFDSV